MSAANGGSSSPLLDVTNVGGAEKYLALPDGAIDPPMRQQIPLHRRPPATIATRRAKVDRPLRGRCYITRRRRLTFSIEQGTARSTLS